MSNFIGWCRTSLDWRHTLCIAAVLAILASAVACLVGSATVYGVLADATIPANSGWLLRRLWHRQQLAAGSMADVHSSILSAAGLAQLAAQHSLQDQEKKYLPLT